MTVQSLCRVKKIVMTSNVLPLHFAPSQASSSQNSNVESYLQYCEVDSLKSSKSELSLLKTVMNYEIFKLGSIEKGIYIVLEFDRIVH